MQHELINSPAAGAALASKIGACGDAAIGSSALTRSILGSSYIANAMARRTWRRRLTSWTLEGAASSWHCVTGKRDALAVGQRSGRGRGGWRAAAETEARSNVISRLLPTRGTEGEGRPAMYNRRQHQLERALLAQRKDSVRLEVQLLCHCAAFSLGR